METARDAIGTRNTTIEGLAAVGSIEATEIDSDEVEYETEQLKNKVFRWKVRRLHLHSTVHGNYGNGCDR